MRLFEKGETYSWETLEKLGYEFMERQFVIGVPNSDSIVIVSDAGNDNYTIIGKVKIGNIE